jgi:hypothetical protein
MKSRGDLQPSWWRDTVLILLLAGLTTFLFRGWLQQGMQMDEVNRVINMIPILHEEAKPISQSTYSLELFGVEIPLMYKEYISTAYIIRFLPLALFDDYLVGLRVLYWFYFLLSAILLFLVLRPWHYYSAWFAPLLMVTAPLYYPEIRIGFADSLYVLFLSLGCYLIHGFVSSPQSRIQLFFGVFLLCFAANQMLYFGWVVAGLALATAILYWDQWIEHVARLRNWIVAAAAASLGLFNFVIYNLLNGFPTISIFFTRILFPDRYNKEPLDYSKTDPFLEDIWSKITQIPVFLGPYWEFSAALIVLSSLVAVCFLVKWLREGRLTENRIYLLPFLTFYLILVLILISPKTTRAGHYVYVIPFVQLAVLSSVLLVGRIFQKRSFVIGLPVVLTAASLFASNQIVSKINQTGGTVLFSPAIFDLSDYFEEQRIDSRNVVFLTWGLHSQSYFLKKGDFCINQLVFSLIDEPSRKEKQFVLKSFLSSSRAQPKQGDFLYFPLFAHYRTDINQALIDLVDSYNGAISLEKVFQERNGQEAILLYRLDHLEQFSLTLRKEISEAPISSELRITRFGPTRERSGRVESLPMWFIADGLSEQTKVALEGFLLKTVYSKDHVTALVPAKSIRESGSYSIFLYDLERRIRSEQVTLQID